jgi:hypothetical protein
MLFGASIGLGVWCVFNRLHSFRNTMHNARDRERIATEASSEGLQSILNERRVDTGVLDKRTWPLLYWQIGTFGMGALFLFCHLCNRFSRQAILTPLGKDDKYVDCR